MFLQTCVSRPLWEYEVTLGMFVFSNNTDKFFNR